MPAGVFRRAVLGDVRGDPLPHQLVYVESARNSFAHL